MLEIRSHRTFEFVPEEFEEEVIDEVMYNYRIVGEQGNQVCLDNDIVQRMVFVMFRIWYFYETGSLLDPAILNDPEEWRYFSDRYPDVETRPEYQSFRLDVKNLLMQHQMMFEENWTFSISSEDYIYKTYNSSIQSVW